MLDDWKIKLGMARFAAEAWDFIKARILRHDHSQGACGLGFSALCPFGSGGGKSRRAR